MITEEGKVIVQHLEAIFDAVDRREIDHPAELLILGFRHQAELITDCEVARHRVLGAVHPEVLPIMPGTLVLLTTKRAPLRADRPPALDSRGRSPAAPSTTRQPPFKIPRESPTLQTGEPSFGKDELQEKAPIPSQDPVASTARVMDLDKSDQGRSPDLYSNRSKHINVACIPSHLKAPHSALQNQSPPSGPSHGAKSLPSQNRGSSISLLSAPTRPRGGASFKDTNTFATPTMRRGPLTPHTNIPPSGPRTSHVPTGPSAEVHRPHAYRQNSVTSPSYPRTPKYTNHLTGLCTIVPGGRLLPSSVELTMEKRLSQLDVDKVRLFEQITESQKHKRMGLRDWDRLDRESSICALKTDFSHLSSIFILLHKMKSSSSCSGLSFKSQALYLMVFVTRYLDLFWAFTDSLYNTTFKILFIGSSAYIIYLMLNDYKPTHDPNLDTFKVQYLLAFSAVLAIAFPHDYRVSEVLSPSHSFPLSLEFSLTRRKILWTFSIWLESIAILPQLFMLQRTGEADTITTHYLFALGIYRALYIPNWIYRYFAEQYFQPIPVIAGIIQTLLYSDFFYIYYNK
ncbi:uncharacterized protein KD926_006620 [Aspergillus affinis]|uniref:uncharacterized protein n=1 Tax=Aspergillus affinis TaxID=1070780 RepID=UPI0022FED1D6|nr:uncharacterized protein KD926_006620 [Aspergillus affinis]KAI9041721.1 hypothetical protein KD926_006620 [Aspergillus affinis]